MDPHEVSSKGATAAAQDHRISVEKMAQGADLSQLNLGCDKAEPLHSTACTVPSPHCLLFFNNKTKVDDDKLG